MEAPTVTRHRRPFFAPLWLILLVAGLFGLVALALYHEAVTTVLIVVRPAERDPGTIADPPISPEGEAQAQRLARIFGDDGVAAGGLDAIYVSDDRRAQQTAAPLAERLHRTPVTFNSGDAGSITRAARRDHGGGAVLLIAGGPAYLKVLASLGVTAAELRGDDADVAYVASVPTFGRSRLVRMRF